MSHPLIDTHAHLDHADFAGDIHELLGRSFAGGIQAIIIPAADPADLPRARELAQQYPGVFFASGTHPCECEKYDEGVVREFLAHEKCLAVGECGLDYFYKKDEETKARQREVFAAQLALAAEFDKPLIIHAREANADIYELLKNYARAGGPGEAPDKNGPGQAPDKNGPGQTPAKDASGKRPPVILHCFNASPLLLGLAGEGGCDFYFGIGGVLTFKNAKSLAEMLPQIPRDRLLLETDAPYLAPHPHRGKRNEPLHTALVLEKMSELLATPAAELAGICLANSRRALRGLG